MIKASEKLIIEALGSVTLFCTAGEEELKRIASQYSREVSFRKGETVFSKESREKCIGVIVKGGATVKKEHIVISSLKQGDIFGAVTLYSKAETFVNDIVADSGCKVVFITKNGVDTLISKSPRFAKSFIEYLSERIYFLNSRIEAYTMPTADDKLYSYLRETAKGKNSFTLNVKMTDLANALNLSRASLYRAFDELCSQGRIIKDGKNIKFI